MLLIQNGHLTDPYTGCDRKMDILIGEDGIILEAAEKIAPPAGCSIYQAAGKTVSPGLVDVHVHFRDPGQTEKEDLMSGAAAAAAGGFTTVVCMANTLPTCDCAEVLADIQKRATAAPIHVLQACAVTKGLKGKELTDFEGLLALGAAGFTDDGINMTDAEICRQAMALAAKYNTVLSFHEEDGRFVHSPGVNYGSKAAEKFGVPGAEAQAEEIMVARDIALALETGAKVSFQHVSAKGTVDLIRAGKAQGAHIYAEVTPHHLALTEDDVLVHGTYARMNPPLRKEEDRLALIAGLCDGTIDMVATDHAPHTAEEKARAFQSAPSGITGLETAFAVCNTILVKGGYLSKIELLDRMSRRPAELYGLSGKAVEAGNPAELMIADWEETVCFERYRSKAVNTPFTGKPLTGKVHAVVMGTKVTEN